MIRQKKIYLVEDNEDTATIVTSMLKFIGFTPVRIPEDFMKNERLEEPVAYLIDLFLSAGSASDLIADLRAKWNSKTPVIVISSEDDPDVIEFVKGLDVQGYLKKPFTIAALKTALSSAIPPSATTDLLAD